MTIHRKFLQTTPEALGDRQVRVLISAGTIDRAGEQVVQSGLDTSAFMNGGGTVLWSHDPEQPIAKCVSLDLTDSGWLALVQFPPEGTSVKADEIYGLIKADIINGASIGFNPTTTEPMDPARQRGAQRYLTAELLEFSFVSIPAVREAGIVERSFEDHMARKTAPKTAAIDPNAAKFAGLVEKGLYQVSQLSGLIGSFAWLLSDVEWEAEYEADGSPQPEMLAKILAAMGEALIQMTQEEVAELLAQHPTDAAVEAFSDATEKAWRRGIVAKGVAAGVMTANEGRIALGLVPDTEKAGKVLSKANHDLLKSAHDHMTKGIGCIKEMLDAVDEAADPAATQTADDDDVGSDIPEDGAEKSISAAQAVRQRRVRVLALQN